MGALVILFILGFAGIGMLGVGLRGLLSKKATVYSGKWLVVLIAVCFFPQFIANFKIITHMPAIGLVGLLMYPALIFVFWRVSTGFIIFGVSESTLSEALKNVLEGMNQKFQQQLASLQLNDGSVLQVAVHEWVGSAQLRPKNKQAKAHIPELISKLSSFFSSSDREIKTFCYWLYAFFGGLLTFMLVVLGFSIIERMH